MGLRVRRRLAAKPHTRSVHAKSSNIAATCLLALCLVLIAFQHAYGQESQQAQETSTGVRNTSEENATNPEETTKERSLFEIDIPSLPDLEKPVEPAREPKEPVSAPTASETELREEVRKLQQDVETLKEEIAALRSELRAIVPKVADQDAGKKQTITPFWITDSQLGDQSPGKAR